MNKKFQKAGINKAYEIERDDYAPQLLFSIVKGTEDGWRCCAGDGLEIRIEQHFINSNIWWQWEIDLGFDATGNPIKAAKGENIGTTQIRRDAINAALQALIAEGMDIDRLPMICRPGYKLTLQQWSMINRDEEWESVHEFYFSADDHDKAVEFGEIWLDSGENGLKAKVDHDALFGIVKEDDKNESNTYLMF